MEWQSDATFARAVTSPHAYIDTKTRCHSAILQVFAPASSAALLTSLRAVLHQLPYPYATHPANKTSVTCVWLRYFCRWRRDICSQQFWECRWFGLERWMFFRLGQMSPLHNWRVITAMRANSIFFSLLCCSVQETGQSFKASSFLTLTQSEGERRKKVSFSHIHTGNSSFCFLYVDEKTPGVKDYCLLCSVHCHYQHVMAVIFNSSSLFV